MSNKDFLIFSILTFITVLIWTVLETYHVYKTSTVPKSLQMQVEQITPTLNREIVEKIKSRYDENALPTPEATIPTPPISTSASNMR